MDYFGRKFPVAPRSYSLILKHRAGELEQRLGFGSPDFAEYQSILTAIGHLPDRTETDPAHVAERHREKEIIKRRLGELTARNETIANFIAKNVAIFNGQAGEPRSFDLLDELLAHQCYRLSFWRVATEEINYRRFFDVNELAAICVEREDVFQAVHELIFRLIGEGKVDGLRVDHPDGLYDPNQYFHRLQRQYLLALAKAEFEAGAGPEDGPKWTEMVSEVTERIEAVLAQTGEERSRWPLYVVAEKILGASEPLPSDWQVDGTVGYEFIRAVTGLSVDGTTEGEFTRLYRDLIDNYTPFPDVLYRSKRLILSVSLAAELNMLAFQLDRLAQKDRRSRDFTWHGLRDALREVIACFPVYRTYISDRGVSPRDREMVETAVKRAAARNPMMNQTILSFVKDMILLEYPPGASEATRSEQQRFAGKLQQLTSPVMAKGLEDTSFYIYYRLSSLNEVGGGPEWPKRGAEAFHRFNADRQAKWPYSLSPLSTHDTKRSEDVRARINVLSEIPREWSEAVRRWVKMNEVHRTEIDGNVVPDANEEYLIYQTLIGAWPVGAGDPSADFVGRIKAYLVKALREGKLHSSWLNPNAQYDEAVQEFAGRLLDPNLGRPFLDDFRAFQARVALCGAINSLSQTVLKLTAPGVADTYQGTELADFSLVDPDNRRPVDYGVLQELLNNLKARVGSSNSDLASLVRELSGAAEDGRAKLFVNWRILHERREHAGLFTEGEYLPLTASGSKSEHLFGFARRHRGMTAVVAVPRLLARLGLHETAPSLASGVWADTRLNLTGLEPSTSWVNVFSGSRLTPKDGTFPATELFADFPVALLVSER